MFHSLSSVTSGFDLKFDLDIQGSSFDRGALLIVCRFY